MVGVARSAVLCSSSNNSYIMLTDRFVSILIRELESIIGLRLFPCVAFAGPDLDTSAAGNKASTSRPADRRIPPPPPPHPLPHPHPPPPPIPALPDRILKIIKWMKTKEKERKDKEEKKTLKLVLWWLLCRAPGLKDQRLDLLARCRCTMVGFFLFFFFFEC